MRKTWLSIPYAIWSLIFSIIPIIIIGVYSFCKRSPYGRMIYEFTLGNYKKFLQPMYLNVFWRSILLALISTGICLVVAYPMAMIIAKAKASRRSLLIMLFVIPLWSNFLLRTYAWMSILRDQGIINQALMFLGIIDKPLTLLYNDSAVVVGMVYNFLPFMVLPIYSVLSKMDESLVEAAKDLGATSFDTFTKVTLPLSMPGVVSGIIMVFMPAVSTFVISDLLGGGKTVLLGNVIQSQFLMARNWQFGSAISIVMMILILIVMLISSKYKDEEGGGLW